MPFQRIVTFRDTSSASEEPRSSFGIVLKPSKTHGSWSVQNSLIKWVRSEFLKKQWNLSTRPSDCGWYAVVVCISEPRRVDSCRHYVDVNYAPRSDVMWMGVPKRAIQSLRRARARVRADVSETGIASGHRVNRSMMVNRWVNPRQEESGPTTSTWMYLNFFFGAVNC